LKAAAQEEVNVPVLIKFPLTKSLREAMLRDGFEVRLWGQAVSLNSVSPLFCKACVPEWDTALCLNVPIFKMGIIVPALQRHCKTFKPHLHNLVLRKHTIIKFTMIVILYLNLTHLVILCGTLGS
jgi:hypothetical protein